MQYPEIMPTVEDVELYAKIASLSKSNKVALANKWGFENITFSSLMRVLWYLSYLTGRCEGSRGVSYITSEGDVYPCTTCAGSNMYKQGNILKTPFPEIWDKKFKNFRKITYNDFKHCKECEIQNEGWVCSGRCPPLSNNLHGSPFVCGYTEFQKESVKRSGKMYLEEHGNPSHYWPKEKT
jgi:radical SAM protein with 4Fe4S-binding SPASM domain